MPFVKSVCGSLINTGYNIKEGEIAQIDIIDYVTKKWVTEGKAKVFDTYEDAVNHTFTPSTVLAAQSLASLNPPVDREGNVLPTPAPTFDFKKSAPVLV